MKQKLVRGLMLAIVLLVDFGLPGVQAIPASAGATLHIEKRVAGEEESIVVQDGRLVRINPDGTRVIVACMDTEQTVQFVNVEKGVYWEGSLENFYDDLHLFVIVHLLQDDPDVRYAVQVQVENVGEDVIAGYPAQHVRALWRPSSEEGGDDMLWQPMQELWLAPALTETLTASGCLQAAVVLELLQLIQSTFSSQRFYGLMNNEDYVPLLWEGFPVRAKMYALDAATSILSEVTRVSDTSAPDHLFSVPESMKRVDSPREVF